MGLSSAQMTSWSPTSNKGIESKMAAIRPLRPRMALWRVQLHLGGKINTTDHGKVASHPRWSPLPLHLLHHILSPPLILLSSYSYTFFSCTIALLDKVNVNYIRCKAQLRCHSDSSVLIIGSSAPPQNSPPPPPRSSSSLDLMLLFEVGLFDVVCAKGTPILLLLLLLTYILSYHC